MNNQYKMLHAAVAQIDAAETLGLMTDERRELLEEELFQRCLVYITYRAREKRRAEAPDPQNELVFNFQDDSMKSIGELLFDWVMEALGYAAICWNPPPERSIFQVDKVRDAGQELIDAILRATERRYMPKPPIKGDPGVATWVDEEADMPDIDTRGRVATDNVPEPGPEDFQGVSEVTVPGDVPSGTFQVEGTEEPTPWGQDRAPCGHPRFEGDKCYDSSCDNYVNKKKEST